MGWHGARPRLPDVPDRLATRSQAPRRASATAFRGARRTHGGARPVARDRTRDGSEGAVRAAGSLAGRPRAPRARCGAVRPPACCHIWQFIPRPVSKSKFSHKFESRSDNPFRHISELFRRIQGAHCRARAGCWRAGRGATAPLPPPLPEAPSLAPGSSGRAWRHLAAQSERARCASAVCAGRASVASPCARFCATQSPLFFAARAGAAAAVPRRPGTSRPAATATAAEHAPTSGGRAGVLERSSIALLRARAPRCYISVQYQQIIPPVMLLDAPLSYRALATAAVDKQTKLPTVMAPSTSRTCD